MASLMQGPTTTTPSSLSLSSLGDLFSEREVAYFGMPPQLILDLFGQALLEEYSSIKTHLMATLPKQCRQFLSPVQASSCLDQWCELFESKLDANYLKFEDFVFDHGLLEAPKGWVPPEWIPLLDQIRHAAALNEENEERADNRVTSLSIEELDKQIENLTNKLKAIEYVTSQLRAELTRQTAKEHALEQLEQQANKISHTLDRHKRNFFFSFRKHQALVHVKKSYI